MCPGCNTRRIVETAAHLVNYVSQAGAVRQRVLELFERRRILSSETVAEMQGCGHYGSFSVHAGVRVAAQDRAGRESLFDQTHFFALIAAYSD